MGSVVDGCFVGYFGMSAFCFEGAFGASFFFIDFGVLPEFFGCKDDSGRVSVSEAA